jgi:hypothetical protein
MKEGRQIYSAAYIMPSAQIFGRERKHSNRPGRRTGNTGSWGARSWLGEGAQPSE